MKYIPAEKLIAEIESRMEDCKLPDGTFPTTTNIVRYEELSSLRNLIVSVQQEPPSLPSELDEAADCYKDTIRPEEVDDYANGVFYETFTEYQIADAFKEGAEWMAGQGKTVEGVFKAGDPGYPDIRMGEQYSIEHILCKPGGIEPGDEVIVQIRKKQ